MRVYRLRNDGNQYQYFLPENEEDWAKLEYAVEEAGLRGLLFQTIWED